MNKIVYILICLLALWLSFLFGRKSVEPRVERVEIVQTDTIVVQKIDTIKIVKPQPYTVIVRDTIYPQYPQNPQGDILVQEVKEYQDSTYYARISGINAYLEEIRVYPRTEYRYIKTTEKVYEKPKKWGIGLQAGYGIGRNGLQPYVGIGVSYNIIVL